jgi:hypothetical protein
MSPLVQRKGGDPVSRRTPLDSRLRGNERKFYPLAARRRARLKKIAASKVSVPITV